MYDDDEGLSAAIGRRSAAGAETWPFPGRHESHDEIAVETPIFHALTVGGWRSRQRGSGRAVRSVHRPTVRDGRSTRSTPSNPPAVRSFRSSARSSGSASGTAETLAGFHVAGGVPQQDERRRDTQRRADRAAIMDLLGGAGRHRLGTPV